MGEKWERNEKEMRKRRGGVNGDEEEKEEEEEEVEKDEDKAWRTMRWKLSEGTK